MLGDPPRLAPSPRRRNVQARAGRRAQCPYATASHPGPAVQRTSILGFLCKDGLARLACREASRSRPELVAPAGRAALRPAHVPAYADVLDDGTSVPVRHSRLQLSVQIERLPAPLHKVAAQLPPLR